MDLSTRLCELYEETNRLRSQLISNEIETPPSTIFTRKLNEIIGTLKTNLDSINKVNETLVESSVEFHQQTMCDDINVGSSVVDVVEVKKSGDICYSNLNVDSEDVTDLKMPEMPPLDEYERINMKLEQCTQNLLKMQNIKLDLNESKGRTCLDPSFDESRLFVHSKVVTSSPLH